jgi:hypothetical protein
MAEEVRKYRVTAVAITPGFLRSEGMLEHFGVTEANWRDGGKKDKNFLESESPLFIGRCVAALAADPNVFERSGDILSSWELGRHYGLTDYDGRRPDWAAHGAKIFESTPFADSFRRHVVFLQRMAARASQYIGADNPAAEPRKTSGKRRAAR